MNSAQNDLLNKYDDANPLQQAPQEGTIKRRRKPIWRYGLIWLIYMISLTVSLLYYFPWRNPEPIDVYKIDPRILDRMSEEDYKKAKRLEDEKNKLLREMGGVSVEIFRRLPVWKETPRDVVLSPTMTQTGTDRYNISLDTKVTEPVKAWDRFALEMAYGVVAAVGIQIIWLLIACFRKRRKKQSGFLSAAIDT